MVSTRQGESHLPTPSIENLGGRLGPSREETREHSALIVVIASDRYKGAMTRHGLGLDRGGGG